MIEEKPEPVKWYSKTSCIVIAFLTIGPLALPLVWMNPRFSQKTKIVVTIIIVVLSYFMALMLINSLNSLKQYYDILSQGNLKIF